MANLTIAIDDELLRRARVRAAEQGTSVNAVLREQLTRYADASSNARAAEAFLSLAGERPGRSAGPWTRDELYAERLR